MVRVGIVLSCAVGACWLALVIYTLRSARRMEPGWSFAPVNVAVETIEAVIALAVIWGVLLALRTIHRSARGLRQQPEDAARDADFIG